MMILLWAAPAHAQTYGGVLGDGQTQGGQGQGQGQGGQGQGSAGGAGAGNGGDRDGRGDLARTGQDNIVPMAQVAFVLLGAGTLLAFVARRRRTEHHATA